jgi:multiple sugar transport system substrate-binding protein
MKITNNGRGTKFSLAAGMAAALSATLLASACSSAPPAPNANAAKPTELRVLYTTDEANSAALASIAPQFKEKFGVDLKIDNMPYDALQQKVFSEFAAGSSYYDMVVVDTPWAPGVVQNLEPLSSYLQNEALNKTSPQSALGDFIPKVFNDTAVYKADSPAQRFPDSTAKPDTANITKAGFDIYGLPIQSNGAVMAYRSDLFNDPTQKSNFKAKYSRDLTVPTTWDEYAQVAEFFTQPDKKLYGTTVMAGVTTATDDFKTLLASYGGNGTLVDENMKPTFNTPEGVAALTYYAKLAQSGSVPPGSNSADWVTIADSFTSGLTAMTINFHDFKLADNVKGGTIGYAPTPRGVSTGPQFGTWMLSINKNSRNKEWTYQAISWLTAAEQQTSMTAKVLHPTRESVYGGIKKDNPLAGYYDTLGKSLATGVGRARLTNWTEVSHEVAIAVNNAVTGSASPSDALKAAETKVLTLLKAAGN